MGKRGLTKIQIQHLLKLNHFPLVAQTTYSHIQIQHLLKLNCHGKIMFLWSSCGIQIQHLLKLNRSNKRLYFIGSTIQIQHLLKLNLIHFLFAIIWENSNTTLVKVKFFISPFKFFAPPIQIQHLLKLNFFCYLSLCHN